MDVKSILGSRRKRRDRTGGRWHALEFGSQRDEVTTPLSGFPKQCAQPTQALVTLPCLTYWSTLLSSHCVNVSGVGPPLCITLLASTLGSWKSSRELGSRVPSAFSDKGMKRRWWHSQVAGGLQRLTYKNGQQNEAGYQPERQDISACLWGLGANLHLSKASILSHTDKIRTSMPVKYTRDWRSEVLSSQCLQSTVRDVPTCPLECKLHEG